MKSIFNIFIISMLTIVLFSNCENQSPTGIGTSGCIDLKLNFVGTPITMPFLNKVNQGVPGIFTKMTVEVYPGGSLTDCLKEVTPMVSTDLQIDSETGVFSGTFEVPAGDGRLFRICLYEAFPDSENVVADSTGVLSYSGRRGGVKVAVDEINQIEIDLYPVPIKNKRVVFWVDPNQEMSTANNQLIPIGVATADSLFGLQFDVVLSTVNVRINDLPTTAVSATFSDRHYNSVAAGTTRIVIFDRSRARNALPPVCDVTAVPATFISLKTDTTGTISNGSEAVQIALINGVVNTINYLPLEVWAVNTQE